MLKCSLLFTYACRLNVAFDENDKVKSTSIQLIIQMYLISYNFDESSYIDNYSLLC